MVSKVRAHALETFVKVAYFYHVLNGYRYWEKQCFLEGGGAYMVPAQRTVDYINRRCGGIILDIILLQFFKAFLHTCPDAFFTLFRQV